MREEHWMKGEGGSRRMALQEREFILGGQCNEDGTTRLEVALLDARGKTRVELRLLGWGEGIGWYVYKRIQLDPLQIRALKTILGRGDSRMKSSAAKLTTLCRIDRQVAHRPQGPGVSLCP